MGALSAQRHSFAAAARRLGVSAGLAFMAASAVVADDGDRLSGHELRTGPGLGGSARRPANPATSHPAQNQRVLDWLSARARRELTQRR